MPDIRTKRNKPARDLRNMFSLIRSVNVLCALALFLVASAAAQIIVMRRQALNPNRAARADFNLAKAFARWLI
jgi:hypothetical protein